MGLKENLKDVESKEDAILKFMALTSRKPTLEELILDINKEPEIEVYCDLEDLRNWIS